MMINKLPIQCECGQVARTIHSVGLSSDHSLVFEWRCSGCKTRVIALKSLAECWRDCPLPNNLTCEASEPAPSETTTFDRRFLRMIHVKLPENE